MGLIGTTGTASSLAESQSSTREPPTRPPAGSPRGSRNSGRSKHVGRKSGKRYRTPLLVFATHDGYGPQTDWVKNVLAGGPTVLHKRGRSIELANPRVVSTVETADRVLPRSRPFD